MTTTYSRHLARAFESLRPEFAGYAANQEKLFARRAEIARAFLKAFDEWKHETGKRLVAFVRELDPNVPGQRPRYVNNRSFQAAWYLLRTAKAESEPKSATRSTLTPFEMLTVFIRSVLPKISSQEKADAWTAIARSSRWHERDLKKLRNAVTAANPMPILPEVPRIVRSNAGHSASRSNARTADRVSA